MVRTLRDLARYIAGRDLPDLCGAVVRTYSVDGEDQLAYEYFQRRPGLFLDLGAGDGRHISNTWLLAEAGWDGHLVEADPGNFTKLRENYWHFFTQKCEQQKFRLLCAALAPAGGGGVVLDWHVPTVPSCEMNATLDRGLLKAGSAWGQGPRVHGVASILPSAALVWFTNPTADYDFVSIDLEGLSLAVLGELVVGRGARPRMFCVETLNELEHQQMKDMLRPLGYQLHRRNSENTIMVRT